MRLVVGDLEDGRIQILLQFGLNARGVEIIDREPCNSEQVDKHQSENRPPSRVRRKPKSIERFIRASTAAARLPRSGLREDNRKLRKRSLEREGKNKITDFACMHEAAHRPD